MHHRAVGESCLELAQFRSTREVFRSFLLVNADKSESSRLLFRIDAYEMNTSLFRCFSRFTPMPWTYQSISVDVPAGLWRYSQQDVASWNWKSTQSDWLPRLYSQGCFNGQWQGEDNKTRMNLATATDSRHWLNDQETCSTRLRYWKAWCCTTLTTAFSHLGELVVVNTGNWTANEDGESA
jgi:hypothetical protein